MLALLVMAAGICAGLWAQINSAYSRVTESPMTTWFAPYVDTTLMPTYDFEDAQVSPSRYSVLGFVVANPHNRCDPTWGTYFGLVGADRQLDLDRRIAELRQRGGDVIISFGGAANQELSVACSNRRDLLNAYRSVVKRYGVRTIDFDIEGAALSDRAANARRAAVLRDLQRWAERAGRPLTIWLTLPVSPDGLTADGILTVEAMLRAGVNLGGVNAMIMDYGAALGGGQSMAWAGTHALEALFHQLRRDYLQAGIHLDTPDLWRRIGATPMIGQNDVSGEIFTLSDAQALVSFARSVGLGRVSMWSANRDYQCSANSDSNTVSDVCSGVKQDGLAFAWELGRLDGTMPNQVQAPRLSIDARPASRDNPLTSPYPVWTSGTIYVGGNKVVWHDEVYQAKWWNQADDPDAPVAHPWDTPWRDLGPVLPSDAPSRIRVSNRPNPWSADQVYLQGDKVTYAGYVFRARWWTQGQPPAIHPLQPQESSWTVAHKIAQAPAPVAGIRAP